jgi:hypothetical protein
MAARRERHVKMPMRRTSQKAKSDHVFGQRRSRPKMFRVELYARSSTNDQETLAMWNRALRELKFRHICPYSILAGRGHSPVSTSERAH